MQPFPTANPFIRAIVVRSFFLWLGVRMILMAVMLPWRVLFFPVEPRTGFVIVTLAAVLGWIELVRRDEHLLLRNLGCPPAAFIGAVSLLPFLVETGLLVAEPHLACLFDAAREATCPNPR